jgi:hypothetical protein
MRPTELCDLAAEAEDLLVSTLTEDERETLQEIYKDINTQVRWGQLLNNAFPALLEMTHDILETGGMTKNNSPWYLVTEENRDLFKEEDPKHMARRHLLLLLLAKKLLGGLKTRVNQAIQDIQILSPTDEMDLIGTVAEAERTVRTPSTEPNGAKAGIKDGTKAGIKDVAKAVIEISPPGDCRQNGRHVRTTVRFRRRNDQMVQETRCKDCRQVVGSLIMPREERKPTKECDHSDAVWVEGFEGKQAVCGNPECQAPIEDPSIYRWSTVGLEPFGDDPSQDEAIILCTDY